MERNWEEKRQIVIRETKSDLVNVSRIPISYEMNKTTNPNFDALGSERLQEEKREEFDAKVEVFIWRIWRAFWWFLNFDWLCWIGKNGIERKVGSSLQNLLPTVSINFISKNIGLYCYMHIFVYTGNFLKFGYITDFWNIICIYNNIKKLWSNTFQV